MLCALLKKVNIFNKNLIDLAPYGAPPIFELVCSLTYICVAIQLKNSRRKQYHFLNRRKEIPNS